MEWIPHGGRKVCNTLFAEKSAIVQFQTSESSVYDHMDHQCQLQIKSGYSFSRVKPNLFFQTALIMTNLESSVLHSIKTHLKKVRWTREKKNDNWRNLFYTSTRKQFRKKKPTPPRMQSQFSIPRLLHSKPSSLPPIYCHWKKPRPRPFSRRKDLVNENPFHPSCTLLLVKKNSSKV